MSARSWIAPSDAIVFRPDVILSVRWIIISQAELRNEVWFHSLCGYGDCVAEFSDVNDAVEFASAYGFSLGVNVRILSITKEMAA